MEVCIVFVIFITRTKSNTMDELNKLLSRLPEKLKYKDGDEIVECGLTFFLENTVRVINGPPGIIVWRWTIFLCAVMVIRLLKPHSTLKGW